MNCDGICVELEWLNLLSLYTSLTEIQSPPAAALTKVTLTPPSSVGKMNSMYIKGSKWSMQKKSRRANPFRVIVLLAVIGAAAAAGASVAALAPGKAWVLLRLPGSGV